MSAIDDQLDELIGSMQQRLDEALAAYAQIKQLYEKAEKQIKTQKDILESLQQVRAKIADRVDDSELFSMLPSLDRLKELLSGQAEPQSAVATAQSPLSPTEVVALTKEVLLSAHRPMKRGALVRALRDRGAQLAGKDENKNLGTILWRHAQDFISVESLGYWVKGFPLEGIYDPEIDDEPLPKSTFVRRRA